MREDKVKLYELKMEFGGLSISEQALYLSYASHKTRQPTYSVWVENYGELQGIITIETERYIEGNFLIPFIGRARILVSNSGGIVYGDAPNIPIGAHIKVFVGYQGLNVPIFAGVIEKVNPGVVATTAEIGVRDFFAYMEYKMVYGYPESNTPRGILENWAAELYLFSDIPPTSDTDEVLTAPTFNYISQLKAVEKIGISLVSNIYFDTNGKLRCYERETYIDSAIWDAGDIVDVNILMPLDIINSVEINYYEDFSCYYSDQQSIDEYRKRDRVYLLTHINQELVASYNWGTEVEELGYDLHGIKFTSSVSSTIIDTVKMRLKQDNGYGELYGKIYTDAAGPDVLIGTSRKVYASDISDSFGDYVFNFDPPILITPSTGYWFVIDKTATSGNIYASASYAAATGQYAVYSSGWNIEDNKRMNYSIHGSASAKKTAEDIVEFCKYPRQRLSVKTYPQPHIELFDRVIMNINKRGIQFKGAYRVTGIRSLLTTEGSYTYFQLEQM